MRTRVPHFAGSWYPADPGALATLVEGALEAQAPPPGRLRGALLPHAGLRYSAPLLGAGLAGLPAETSPSILVLAPSHYAWLAPDCLHGSAFDGVATPLGVLAGWPTPAQGPWRRAEEALAVEHSVEMMLPFLARRCPGARVALVLVPELTSAQAAASLVEALEDFLAEAGGEEVVLASTDMTHYGPRFSHTPFGFPGTDALGKCLARDRRMLDLLAAGDLEAAFASLESLGPTMCGRHASLLLAALAGRRGWKGQAIGQDDSLHLSGRRDDDFVTYAALAYLEEPHGTA